MSKHSLKPTHVLIGYGVYHESMEKTEQALPEPIIVKRGKKHYVVWGDRELGPWDWVGKLEFTYNWGSWDVRVKKGGNLYLLVDGIAHGPFDRFGRERWHTWTHDDFVCTVIRGREIFLIENGRMEKKGEVVEKDGGTFLEIGGGSFGPYRKVTDLLISPGGKRWTADVEKQGRWHGFVVDGVEYGPYPKQFFGARFSPDGSRWFVALDRGQEDSVCSFILDGKTHGRFRIGEMIFLQDNLFQYTFTRRGRHFVVLEGREIGPFLHDSKDFEMTWEYNAVMGYIRRGREKPRRCIIYIWLVEQNRRVFFSANGGETLEDAIEIINAGNTDQGVAAEHLYLKILFGERKRAYELSGQRLIQRNGRHYDQLVWQAADGEKGSIFFDITGFFGRFAEQIAAILGKPGEGQEPKG